MGTLRLVNWFELTRSFILGSLSTLLAVVIAGNYFSKHAEMVATGLIAISLAQLLKESIERNRKSIWEERTSSWQANARLAEEVCALFLGIFLAAIVALSVMPASFFGGFLSRAGHFQSSYQVLFSNNFQILVGGVAFALFYQGSGLVMILAWNALNWAAAFVDLGAALGMHGFRTEVALAFVAIAPHLIFELLAYVISGLAGVFMSRGIIKYRLVSAEFHRVSRACLALLVIGVLVLSVATLLESKVAGPALNNLRETINSKKI